MTDQYELWAERPIEEIEPNRKLSKQELYERFHRVNPHVYSLVVSIARELRDDYGFRVCSINFIFQRIRWLAAIRTANDGFKINNNYAPFYARAVMWREPDLVGFFRVRAAEADAA